MQKNDAVNIKVNYQERFSFMDNKHFLEYFGWFNPRLYNLTLNEHINCLINLSIIFDYKSEYYYTLNKIGPSKSYHDLSIKLDIVVEHLQNGG